MVSKLDFLKMFSEYDDDIDFADFSPEELEDMMRDYLNEGDRPLSPEEFKEKYFEYYDDVKDKSRKRQDW